jgi:hypothetical protein
MLTNFVVANPNEAEAVSSSVNCSSNWPCFEANGLDNAVLAALWSALDPSADASSLEGEAHLIYMKDKDGPWVFNIPTPLVTALGALSPASFLSIAEQWVKSPELAHAGMQGSDVVPAIEALSSIASTAVKQHKSLLLWMSL